MRAGTHWYTFYNKSLVYTLSVEQNFVHALMELQCNLLQKRYLLGEKHYASVVTFAGSI